MNELLTLIENAGAELTLEKDAVYEIDREVRIEKAITIHGNGAIVRADKKAIGLLVTVSCVTVEDLRMEGFLCAVQVDPFGGECENIAFRNLTIDMLYRAFLVSSCESEGIIRNVTIEDCTLRGADQWNEDEGAGLVPISVSAAKLRDGCTRTVKNAIAENIMIKNNRILGGMRIGMSVSTSVPVSFVDGSLDYEFENNVVRNVSFIGNSAEACWDSPFNIMSGYGNSKNDLMENVLIEGNDLGFGISGCYLHVAETLFGATYDPKIRGVRIMNNHLKRVIEDVGEPSRGLFLTACRGDYYPGVRSYHAVLEDVEVAGNVIDGAGIVIAGIYALLDGDMTFDRNIVQRVDIHHNRILNADYAFTIETAQTEARIYDWNFGYPRHDKRWAPDITDHSVPTLKFLNNEIRDLAIHDNEIDGYRYKVLASAADLRGHAYAEGNKLTENITFENNTYNVGENHFRVAGFIGEDYATDGGGNVVSDVFRTF